MVSSFLSFFTGASLGEKYRFG